MKTKITITISLIVIFSALVTSLIIIKVRETGVTNVASATTQGGDISLDQSQQQSDNTNLSVEGTQTSTMPTAAEFMEYEKLKTETNSRYLDTVVGTGAVAETGKKVAMSYKGWLTNGTLFDQSKDGTPFVFNLGAREVIAGWDQGIVGMKVGGKRRLVIPPAAGYGDRGVGPIPGGAVLVFDVELLGVQ